MHLGFTFLIVPIAISLGDLIRSKELKRAGVDDVLKRTMDLIRSCGDPEDSLWISKTILEASPSYIFKYQGRGYDVLGSPTAGKSFWGFIEDFKTHDLILNEIWSGYKRTREAHEIICSCYPHKLYEGAVAAFIAIGSKTVDTLIARKKGYKVAIKVRDEMQRILSLLEQGTQLWRVYAELLHKEFKAAGINPGSIADIVAAAAGLCITMKAVERFDVTWASSSSSERVFAHPLKMF